MNFKDVEDFVVEVESHTSLNCLFFFLKVNNCISLSGKLNCLPTSSSIVVILSIQSDRHEQTV